MSKTNFENFLSKDTTDCLKGYLALCIIIHHLYQFTGLFTNTYLGHFLNLLGSWATACFMFLTGYGLYTSYLNKGYSYIKCFPKKRILPFYISYLIYLTVYIIYDLICDIQISFKSIIHSLTFGGTLISFGWYFQVALLFYIAFWIIFSIKCSAPIHILLIATFSLSYTIISYQLCFSKNVISLVFSFTLGLFVAYKKSELYSLFNQLKTAFISFCIFFILYLAYVFGVIMGRFTLNAPIETLTATICELSVCIFMVSVSCLVGKNLINNPASRFLGRISLDFYAIQGLVLSTLNKFFPNKIIFIAFSLLCTSFIALCLNAIRSALLKRL